MLFTIGLLFVLVAIVLLAVVIWRSRQDDSSSYAVPLDKKSDEEDDLRSLGIMDIRPREKAKARPKVEEKKEADTPEKTEPPSRATPVTEKPEKMGADRPMSAEDPSPDDEAERVASTGEDPDLQPEEVTPREAEDEAETEEPPHHPVWHPLLESLRQALNAHTACLLKQEELALTYEVKALTSDEPAALRSGTFSTRNPLLTATMTQRAVSVRHVGQGGLPLTTLGFYREPVSVAEVGFAPITRPESPSTYFLLVDSLAEEQLGTQRGRKVLAQYAQLFSTVLEEEPMEEVHEEQPQRSEHKSVRPRREIIAEEIADAEQKGQPLALALVHLRDAEVIADDGLGAVARAERMLRKRLEKASPDARVERFGELTFGIFHRSSISDLETWASDVQDFISAEEGVLSGGISIGVAMLGERHQGDAEALRNDATAALREAYETGAATLIE